MELYVVSKGVHYAIGVIALATFWTAALTRKGSLVHKFSGKIYLLSMIVIVATAAIMTALAAWSKPGPVHLFLAYLLVITSTGMWLSWRAIRDKKNFAAYSGRVFVFLMVLNPLVSLCVLVVGLQIGSVLFGGFSLIGFFTGVSMWSLRRRGPTHALWWRSEHIRGMLGNGVATHIAFLSIGLKKVLPMLAGPGLDLVAWFGTPAVAVVLGIWLSRKYAPPRKGAALQTIRAGSPISS